MNSQEQLKHLRTTRHALDGIEAISSVARSVLNLLESGINEAEVSIGDETRETFGEIISMDSRLRHLLAELTGSSAAGPLITAIDQTGELSRLISQMIRREIH